MDPLNQSITQGWSIPSRDSASAPASAWGSEKPRKRSTRPSSNHSIKKQKRNDVPPETDPPAPVLRLDDMGGIDNVIEQLKEHLVMPLLDSQEYVERHVPIPRGVLLHGPPGCGKTVICRAFAAEMEVPFIEILGPSVVSSMSGESEKQIREQFEKAKQNAPSLLFIDEIDVIAPKREDSPTQMDKRMTAQILICMDELAQGGNNDGKPVIVIAATNRPDSLDPALRRGGRFDTEINMGVPNEAMREKILLALTRGPKLAEDVDFKVLARKTAGYVGADLRDLVSKAGTWSMTQYRHALEQQASHSEIQIEIDGVPQVSTSSNTVLSVRRLIKRIRDKEMPRPSGFDDTALTMKDFLSVLPTIIPSSKREGFATVPDTTWKDVGALEQIRKSLHMAIVEPITNPERFKRLGLPTATGVLLWGPPGCGKTLLAKAVTAESKANFISVKGPELLNKYVGESERAVRQVFQRARSSVPCVMFFDEVDALIPRRQSEQSEASVRVVNTLLTELDGLSERDDIYIIAATNRPDMIDRAMLRPGRFETLLYVALPTPDERISILSALIAKMPGMNPDLAAIAGEDCCSNFSGADLKALLRQAGMYCLSQSRDVVLAGDLEVAAKVIRPSVGDIQPYERFRKEFETKMW